MPNLRWDISLGSVLTALVLLVSMAAAYSSARTELSRLHTDFMNSSTDHRLYRESMEGRVRSLENGAVRADERHANLLQILGRIEAQVQRFDGARP